jgi:hypothetical protein
MGFWGLSLLRMTFDYGFMKDEGLVPIFKHRITTSKYTLAELTPIVISKAKENLQMLTASKD